MESLDHATKLFARTNGPQAHSFSAAQLQEFLPLFQWSLLALFFLLVLLTIVYSLRLGISPMPSSARSIQAICSFILPSTQGQILELGAGWGGLLFALHDHAPNAKVEGFELSPIPWLWTRCRLQLRPSSRIILRRRNFFHEDLSHADIIVCYLYRDGMRRLGNKLAQELQPGAIVLSHTFSIPGWTPTQTLQLDDLYRTPIYLYRIPNPLQTDGHVEEINQLTTNKSEKSKTNRT